MLLSGMTSVTFRKHSIEKVVALARTAKLAGIEWGGDIHVPPMNKEAIATAKSCTGDAGLKIFSYGSYYSPFKFDDYLGEAEKVLETAKLLGCARVRIWAGEKWRHEATQSEFEEFILRMQKVGELAEKYEACVCFEHHQNTFCDSGKDALEALSAINHERVRTYWQPIQPTEEENLACIALLKQFVDTVHVYHWKGWDRFMLSEGKTHWEKYLNAFMNENREIPCLLEFCKDDKEENFLADAKCLLSML